jgi:ATP-dependent Lhr-like helicase
MGKVIPDNALAWAHPLVQDWFSLRFAHATEPQVEGWPIISQGKNILISAPTGSGKTLAAFLVCIDRLVRASLAGQLTSKTEVVYISPLKALSNDIQKNLLGPLQEIKDLAKSRAIEMLPIEVAVRTGDTLAKDRQAMLKKPPHILVTTPESFYLLLTASKSRENLLQVKTVIIDEIHALVSNKRGTHLLLSLVRLDRDTVIPPQRIGLSATQKPLSVVAEYMSNRNAPLPHIVSLDNRSKLEINIEVPSMELGPVASNEQWDDVYDRLAQLTLLNRSTLIFVNTRKLAERVAHHLADRLGKEYVLAHHGSLSRKLRLNAETQLKNGALKALVATASLELGIDIGMIDLVCQIGSTRSIATALQRVGRAGHWYGAISKGKIFPTTRDELLEAAALVYAIKQGEMDTLVIPYQPLDILMQQIVASCSTQDWLEEDLYQQLTQAYPYRELSRKKFEEIVGILSEGIASSRGRYSAYLHRDQVNGLLKARRGSKLVALTSGGAIPENGLFQVIVEPQEISVGTLDEDFAIESNRGDVILLGSTSWKVKRVESSRGRVLVEDAHGAPPSIPFWNGEAPGRTLELSAALSKLRSILDKMLASTVTSLKEIGKQKDAKPVVKWLMENCALNRSGAEQIVLYLIQGREILGAIPSQETLVIERFFDEGGGMQLILHSPFGARINKAWGMSLRKRFCHSFNFELQAAATDDGINIALAEQHSFPLQDVFKFLDIKTVQEILVQSILQSPLFKTRWRWDAMRALALVRFRGGKKLPLNVLRMISEDLLAAVFPDAAACQDNIQGPIALPDHPLIEETMKDCLQEAMDLEGLKNVLQMITTGKIRCVSVDTPIPSVFSHEILNANPYAFLDDAPLEERRARAVELRRILPSHLQTEIGRLDKQAIIQVEEQIWPDIRNADELHDFLLTVNVLPKNFALNERTIPLAWMEFIGELRTQGRILPGQHQDFSFWLATERVVSVTVLFPDLKITQAYKKIPQEPPSYEVALSSLIKGWMGYLGPITAQHISNQFYLPLNEVDQTFLILESSGAILRGFFRSKDQVEWCDRRILARIHRATLSKLRKEIEAVTPAQYMRWLLEWQHVNPGSQLKGENGLLEIIRILQGFEIPANAWEKDIFSKRVVGYQKEWLDNLCINGVVGWGRLRSHPALSERNAEGKVVEIHRIHPSSVSPISFFIRGETAWMTNFPPIDTHDLSALSHVGREIFKFLQENGASFLMDIKDGLQRLHSEVELGLWELVSAGLITADGFDNLRALIDPKRRLGKRARYGAVRVAAGRWTLLKQYKNTDLDQQIEALCKILLKRYGIVFRELIKREKFTVTWRELAIAFRRLEDRGEIRGGRFVSGFIGEQFALPIAVDSLRAYKNRENNQDITSISVSDPLNLVGIIIPGEKMSSLSKKSVILCNGEQV